MERTKARACFTEPDFEVGLSIGESRRDDDDVRSVRTLTRREADGALPMDASRPCYEYDNAVVTEQRTRQTCD
jgi:hypothetical protein